MNTPDDQVQPGENFDLRDTENLLTATLDRHATEAPADHTLLSAVHRRLHRRRTGRTIGAVVLACAAVAVGITASQALPGTPPKPPTAKTADVAAKPGWRWESYRTVQVQVPAGWTQYISGEAPCPSSKDAPPPRVGRFSPWLKEQGRFICASAVLPLAVRQEYLWFDDVQKPGVKQYDGGWTEETRDVDGVHVSVLTKNDELRRQILDSAVKITDRDAYGCEVAYTATESSGPLPTDLGKVTSVDICEYWTGGVTQRPQEPLIAGSRLTGKQAEAIGRALKNYRPAAPGSSNKPAPGCSDDQGRTYQLMVHGTNGTWHGTFAYTRCTYGSPSPESTILELIHTGVHWASQPSDFVLNAPGYTRPER